MTMFWRKKTFAKDLPGNRLEILLYHFVSDAQNDFTLSGHTVSTNEFRRQLMCLLGKYTLVRWSEIPALCLADPQQRPFAAVCFDDGYQCILEEAYPILEQCRVPAAMFVNLSVLGNRDLLWRDKIRFLIRRHLEEEFIVCLRAQKHGYDFSSLAKLGFYKWSKNPKAIRSMRIHEDLDVFLAGKGIHSEVIAAANRLFMDRRDVKTRNFLEFGNHTSTHPIMTLLSREEQRAEIGACHDFLVGQGIQPVGLSLPFSPYNRDTVSLCRELSYPVLLTVYEQSNHLSAKRKDRPLILHRWMAPREPAGFDRIP